jgi:hypothetical protein
LSSKKKIIFNFRFGFFSTVSGKHLVPALEPVQQLRGARPQIAAPADSQEACGDARFAAPVLTLRND